MLEAADPRYHVDPTISTVPAMYVSDPGFVLVCELDVFLGATASAGQRGRKRSAGAAAGRS